MSTRSCLLILSVILVIIIHPFSLFAVDWEQQSPTMYPYDYRSIQFVNDTIGWVCGYDGAIIHTTNAGQSWDIQNCHAQIHINGCYFLDSNNGWMVGDSVILQTTDGGDHWTNQVIHSNSAISEYHFRDVHFFDSNRGLVIGYAINRNRQGVNTILYSSNGGQTWSERAQQEYSGLKQVTFTDSLNGWAAGYSILHTTNGGLNWDVQISNVSMNAISFVNSRLGWAVGNAGPVFHTTNSGATWIAQTVPATITDALSSVTFTDSLHGWACGYRSFLIYTNDGGATWEQYPSTPYGMNSIIFTNSNNGWIACNGALLRTTDRGVTWSNLITGDFPTFQSVDFVNRTNGWAAGDGMIYHTTDGSHWSTAASYTSSILLTSIDCIDSNRIWAAGELHVPYDPRGYYNIYPLVHYSTDGGSNWMSINRDSLRDIPKKVKFTSASDGWILNWYSIYHTTNGGIDWNFHRFTEATDYLLNLDIVGNHCWVVGGRGFIFHTGDGGQSWSRQNSPVTGSISDVSFVDSLYGWCVSGYEKILHTTDGGNNWTIQRDTLTYRSLTSIDFIDRDHGWAVGWNGCILHTTDGGNSWIDESYLNNMYYDCVKFTDIDHGWIVGHSGVILHTSNGGQAWIEEPHSPTIPACPTLFPNYPNPFNSSTTISYSLPTSGNIDLKVFDMQGREISTLDQGYRRAGNYQLNFDGKQLSSGTYFVRLMNDQQQTTRKMILMK